MFINMNTRGYNWKKHVRDSIIFVALVTPAWHKDALAKRQYHYAQELSKTIFLLVKAGTPLPENADNHHWYVWETTEELVTLVAGIEQGTLPTK